MSRLAAVLVLALASACGPARAPVSPGATSVAEAESQIATEQRAFAATFQAAVAKARADVGADLFTPERETRQTGFEAPPPSTVSHPRYPELQFFVEKSPDGNDRVAFVMPLHDPCAAFHVVEEPVFARTPDGKVRIVIVAPQLTNPTLHAAGTCAMPGCGAHPPPPPLSLAWLAVSSPAEVEIFRRPVEGTVHRLTCDHPVEPT